MASFTALVVLALVAVSMGFKIGEDSPYTHFGDYSPGRQNPYLVGEQPGSQPWTWRPKFTPSYVQTMQPLGSIVLTTRPNDAPRQAWQSGVSVVVATGPQVTKVKEGDMVYTQPECPLLNRVWLNKPHGGKQDMVCRRKAITVQGVNNLYNGAGVNARGITDVWCQQRSCSPSVADKCEWAARTATTPSEVSAPYCYFLESALRGKVTPDLAGGQPHNMRKAGPNRDVRSEVLNNGITNGL
eukprot:NODE_5686_length_919_cov_146.752513_g5463_i0.p1 GENE.NODE_5686_length_919_cov_146.752513_g5463_i0~~NODE_5686_length_919_cov_146.752513_g5463_i0.p1  ORF type:complete len:260 (-),score=93.39 NODE_5686_length_919_cov_146.752513_g5463_i0:139-861(-)